MYTMSTKSFVTLKDFEGLLRVLEEDTSPDTFTRVTKFMLCIHIAEFGCSYDIVKHCVMQLQCYDMR